MMDYAKEYDRMVEQSNIQQIEIETLRQELLKTRVRVRELEDDLRACEVKWNDSANCCAIATNELATLKQGQGEPVATLHDDGHWTFTASAPHELKHKANYAGWRLPVYTSAPTKFIINPTIPEGWQLVPIDPTYQMLEVLLFGKGKHERVIYQELISAAPKYENPPSSNS